MNDFIRFTKTIFLVMIISFGLCSLFTYWALWLNISTYGKRELEVPNDCHTIIIGNSMSSYAFNDTILSPWKNLSQSGQYYLETAPALDLTLKTNTQIDTVIIGVGIPAFNYFIDEDYRNRDFAAIEYFGKNILLDDDLFKLNFTINPYFFGFLLTHGIENLIEYTHVNGQYNPHLRHTLMSQPSAGIKSYENMRKSRGKLSYSKKEIEENHTYQIQGLKKLISICERHDAECILINTPMYHIDRYIKDDGYKELMASLGDSLLIADYSSFQFPDTCFYGDVHHINYEGSVYFSTHLKKEGLKTQFVKDYANGTNAKASDDR